MSNDAKKIEIISGDGKELNFSDVSTHLAIAKPKAKDDSKKQEIVIPQAKKKTDSKDKK